MTGIAPAPRGVPQIEVTFNIDRNGIVNVSAKDLGTGNEQKVTITSSTNLTEDEIKQRVKEAEQYAAEDKKRKEEVETLNRADSMIFEVDKQIKELGDKLSAEDKATVEDELAEFKKVRETNDAGADQERDGVLHAEGLRGVRQDLPAAGRRSERSGGRTECGREQRFFRRRL